jgi:hypothetical protein
LKITERRTRDFGDLLDSVTRASNPVRSPAYVPLRLSNDIHKVRAYCLNSGCEFAAVTNGQQWIFFKTFQNAQDWREIRAFVVGEIAYFSKLFIEAHNNFSYNAIVDNAALRKLFLDGTIANRELFYPKDRISVYDASVDANGYASSLRPIADKYFGAIDVGDTEFMENCYVSDREYDIAFTSARRRLEDSITPFLEQFNIRDFRDSERGGGFGNRISKNVVGPQRAPQLPPPVAGANSPDVPGICRTS